MKSSKVNQPRSHAGNGEDHCARYASGVLFPCYRVTGANVGKSCLPPTKARRSKTSRDQATPPGVGKFLQARSSTERPVVRCTN